MTKTVQATYRGVDENGAHVATVRRGNGPATLDGRSIPSVAVLRRGDRINVYRKAKSPYLYFHTFAG